MNRAIPSKLPANAECRCVLSDGRVLTVTASRRPRANRADVKCVVAGAPALSERMQELVRLARHTESRFDSRDQVVLSMDIAPDAEERGWELAAVLADRMVRGVWQPAQPLAYAHGWSDHWHLGGVTGQPALAAAGLRALPASPCPAVAVLGGAQEGELAEAVEPVTAGPQGARPALPSPTSTPLGGGIASLLLTHLGGLTGHADPSAAVSSARAWFPLHSGGINDSLCWVEVSVYPAEQSDAGEEDTIAVPGVGLTAQLAVRQALSGARHFDGRALGRWRTVVRFGQPRFQGASYELALVMADRLARGREFVPRGRIVASGCSSAWHAGRVDTVEGREAKLELILKQAVQGDRVLLPKDWQNDISPAYAGALRAAGASLACIERIGVI
ncbi:hypothetical protein LJR289_002345 [Pseudoduganella sp. LjRoot289]|uniref:hypothetical protein n=1 Tax=Pseudoduganella sp. LjRoot289 TaxID=3342314 RepID=UPI003ED0FCF0